MQGKNKSFGMDRQQLEARRRRQIRAWIILIVMIIGVMVALNMLKNVGKTTEIGASRLTCYASQDVTPFGENVLYYDGASVHCLSGGGAIRWSYPVGTGAAFSCSDTHLVIWSGAQLYIVDQNGQCSYNEMQPGEVQFARVGSKYAAVVVGSDTDAELLLKDLEGAQVDEEREAFRGMLLLDVGFYGEQDQYLWSLAMDVYGTALNTVMNTFQVGKMNTGEVSLGEKLAYRVLYENNKLRVFTTQQLYTYNYKAVQDTNSTMLVYGWKHIDTYYPERGDASLLLAPTTQTNSSQVITELRLLSGDTDRRYTLPSACVGAMSRGNSIYAFSGEYIYRANVGQQRFYAYDVPLPEGEVVTGYIGKLDGGRVLLTSGETVYSVTLPQ